MPRSIGSVEITVNADTKRLRVGLVKDAESAGREAKKALDAELSKVEAELFLNSKAARADLEKFKTAAERAGVKLDLGVDVEKAKVEVEKLKEEIARLNAEFSVDMKKADQEKLEAKIDKLEEEKHQIEFAIEMEPKAKAILEAQLKRIEQEQHTVQINAVLDSMEALAELQLLEEDKVSVGFTADLGEASAEYQTWAERINHARLSPVIDGDTTDLEITLKELKAQMALERFQVKLALDEAAFEAEVARVTAERRELQVQAILDADKFEAEVAARIAEAKRAKLKIPVVADMTEINRNLEQMRLHQSKDKVNIKFHAELETALLEAQAEAVIAQLEHEEATINLGVATARATAEMEAWIKETEHLKIRTTVDPLTAKATAAFEAWLELQREKGIDTDVDPDTIKATIEFEAWLLRMQHRKIEVDVETDPDIEDKLAKMLTSAGDTGGKGFSGGFGKNMKLLPGQFTEWLPLIAAAIEPIGPMIEGVLGGATQVISSAFSALAGGAGALAPIFAGLAATLGATVVGSLGLVKSFGAVTKEWGAATEAGRSFNFEAKEIQKTLRNMGPAAQSVVREFADLFPLLRNIQQTVAEHLFVGMGEELKRLSGTLLPDVGTALVHAADSANRFFTGMAKAAEGMDFTGVFDAISPALDIIGKAMANVFGALEPLLKSTAPAALSLAFALEKGAGSLTKLIDSGAESGALTEFFTEGVASLVEWAKLIGSVSKALFTLFEAGKKGGDGMISSLTKVTDKFNDWMKSTKGQEALAKFFDQSREILKDLGPLLGGLAKGLKNIITASTLDSFHRFTEDLGEALPVIGDIIGLLSRANITGSLAAGLRVFTDALKPVLPSLQKLADTIGVALHQAVEALTPMLQHLAGFLGSVAEAATPVIEALGNMIAVLKPLTPLIEGVVVGFLAWKVINGITRNVADGLTGLGGKLVRTQENFTLFTTAVGQAGGALKGIGTGIATAVKGGGLDQIGNSMKALGPAVAVIGKASGAVIGTALAGGIAAGFGFEMIRTADNVGDKIVGFAQVAGAAVGSFFAVGGGPQGVAAAGLTLAIGAVSSAFKDSAEKAKEAKAEVDKFAKAILEMERTGSTKPVVLTVLDNLKDLTDQERDLMRKAKLDAGAWADKWVNGTETVNQATADWLETLLGAQDPLVDMVRSGKVSLEQLTNTFAIAERPAAVTDQAYAHLGQTLEALGLNSDQVATIFGFLTQQSNKYASAAAQNKEATEDAARAQRELEAAGLANWGVINDLGAIIPDTTGSLYGFGAAADEAAVKAQFLAEGAAKIDAQKMADGLDALDTAMGRTGDTFDTVKDQVFGVRDALTDTEKHWVLIAEAADKAAEKASDFADVMDKMLNPALDMAEATSDFEADLDGLSGKLQENAEKTAEWNKKREEARKKGEKFDDVLKLNTLTLDLNTEAGRENASSVRKGIKDIEGWGEAALAQGKSTDEVTAGMLQMRQELIKQVAPFAGGEAAAEAYVNALNLTPDNIKTSVDLIGIQEAATKILDYDFDLDGVRDSVDTTFNLPNLDDVRKRLAEAGVDVSKLSDPVLIEFLTKGFTDAQKELSTTDKSVETAGGTVPIDAATTQAFKDADAALMSLGGVTETPVTVGIDASLGDGWGAADAALATVGSATDGVKTVTIDFNFLTNAPIIDDIGALLSMGGQGTQTIPQIPVQATMTGFEDADAAIALLGGSLPPIPTTVAAPDATEVTTAVANITTTLEGVSKEWPVTITLPNIDTTKTKVEGIDTALDNIKDKTVTLTVNTVYPNGLPPGVLVGGNGKQPGPGSMAGRLVNSPMTSRLGERGYREAVVPLDLPLNRVSPEVRAMAALLRGEGPTTMQAAPGKTVNNYLTVTPLSANPEVVATQLINRSVALARS